MFLGDVVLDSENRNWLVCAFTYGKTYELALIPEGETIENFGRTWFRETVERRILPWITRQ